MTGQAKRSTSRLKEKSADDIREENRRLKKQLKERTAALNDALKQQSATAGILRVISSSSTDVQPTFDAIVASAAKLCEAEFSAVARFDDGLLHLVATNNLLPEEAAAFHSLFPRPALPNFVMGRAFVEGRPAQFEDVLADTAYDTRTRQVLQSALGYRTFMAVPIFRAGVPIGVVGCARRRVEPFTATQIELLNTFAEQAAIALDNVRLFNELGARNGDLTEALEYQTATSDVLKVISHSDAELGSVLEKLVETATRLCQADHGYIFRRHDGRHHLVASFGVEPEFRDFMVANPFVPDRGTLSGRVALEHRIVHIDDAATDPEYTLTEAQQRGNLRTGLGVPLLRDDTLLGIIILYRSRVERFTEKQIGLAATFADQAVIAIENARLLGELRERTDDLEESLEYQTATSDVLKVISRSTLDLQPVLETVVETATRLCAADMGFLLRREGDVYRAGAAVGFSPEYEEFMRAHPIGVDRGSVTGRVAHECRTVHIADVAADPEHTLSESTTLAGQRTALGVPLMREGQPIGVIVLARRRVEPFTEKHIELVTTFADQAVIAMENARLITETREALEQQTATAEVLGVINSSPGNLVPVFEAILEKAHALCDADHGTLTVSDGKQFRAVAMNGMPEAFAEILRRPFYPTHSFQDRLLEGQGMVHIPDITKLESSPDNPVHRAAIDLGKVRTLLMVALRKDGVLLGYITANRQEVRPFTDKQIALLENFAAQAVIAIENARLITETREALDQQTATAEVLGVINSSPGDLGPVFEAMLEKAMRLCTAAFGYLMTFDGERFEPVAHRGLPHRFAQYLAKLDQPGSSGAYARIRGGAPLVHITDLMEGEVYRSSPLRQALVDLGGARTGLIVALRKDETLLGVFTIYRQEVRRFSDKQIALLQNFAAQAVIAMENARLITETREALEQQTATAEVLQVINSSPGDLAPVFDAMLEKAHNLCGSTHGVLGTYDGVHFRAVATKGLPKDLAALMGQPFRAYSNSPHERLAIGERVVHIPDLATEARWDRDDPKRRASLEIGIHTLVFVPLRKDGALLGYISADRLTVQPFSEKEIGLLENFAAQAVIAMENARLIIETRDALEQQTATSEVLQVINSSPGDLTPVFDAMLERAMRLCEAAFGILRTYDGNQYHAVAAHGVPPAYAEFLSDNPQQAQPGTMGARILKGEPLVHIIDAVDDEVYRDGDPHRRALVDLGGGRTSLAVPLTKDRVVLGGIQIYRQEVRRFSDKQIALLQNFAAQAVIAMENARLITETREALDQQTATAEVLGVINASPGDLAPVFDAMLEKAVGLCDAAHGVLRTFDGEFFHLAAMRGEPDAVTGLKQLGAIDLGSVRADDMLGPIVRGESVVHIADVRETDTYRDNPVARERAETANQRTWLVVALRKDGALLGVIMIYRTVVRPFTEKQIALVQNFAVQAVIAMENARLITETREALEQQTATAEVLQVINSSPGNLTPVFDAMLEKALRLCEAAFGILLTYDGARFHHAALCGVPVEYAEFMRKNPPNYGPESGPGRILTGERLIHFLDLKDSDLYRSDDPNRRAIVDLAGARTMTLVPLLKDEDVQGIIVIFRQEVRPFSDKQIALLQNFAAQAVIAMENARLITETQEALEQQTATAEVLQVINSSPGDLAPVFDAILEKAHSLCEAAFGSLFTYDGEFFHGTASHGLPEAIRPERRGAFRPGLNNPLWQMARGAPLAHIPDMRELVGLSEPSEASEPGHLLLRAAVEQGSIRTMLMVPLRKDGALLGVISAYRQEVKPFTDKQIALLQNFAAQAVIAMENARLLDEIRQRQAELRVTFDNMADGVVMFDEHLRLAAWNRNCQEILDLPDAILAERPSYADYVRMLAARGEFGTEDMEAELSRRLEHTDQELRVERTRPDGRVIEVRRNSVPDGGFVLIYSDITERKRSEAEIGAARDTAEATLRDLRAAQANLIQAEKMASLGQLTAGIAHEIKNPLNFVNNFAGLSVELLNELKETAAPAIGSLDEDKRTEIDETIEMLTSNLEKIAEHGRRADGIVKSMLEHSRGGIGERRSVDLNALIEEALNLAYHGGRAQDQSFNISLERDYAHDIAPIELVPQDITRVCLNLFGNGFYAATKRQREGADSTFKPTLRVSTRDLGDAVEIQARDNGIGIPLEIKDKLFQPFFTTKPTGEGTGLGLSISYDIVTQQHGGTIEVDSRVGEFTEFTVRLPRRQ